jgi:hypothetical protein
MGAAEEGDHASSRVPNQACRSLARQMCHVMSERTLTTPLALIGLPSLFRRAFSPCSAGVHEEVL